MYSVIIPPKHREREREREREGERMRREQLMCITINPRGFDLYQTRHMSFSRIQSQSMHVFGAQ